MRKKIAAIIAALMVTTVGLTACSGNNNNEPTNNGNNNGENSVESNEDEEDEVEENGSVDTEAILNVGLAADPTSFHLHQSNDQPTSRVGVQMYEGLVATDENNEIIPCLAESWEFIDETTTQFKLREGVLFHNGEELTAADVKFSIEGMTESAVVGHIAGAIDSVEIIDDYTVNIITEHAFGPLLYHLAHPASAIMNEKAVTEAGDSYGTDVVIGTGPFMLESWSASDSVNLVRFDDYREEPAQLAGVSFKIIPEMTNLTIGLETGDLDLAYDILPLDQARIEDDSDLNLVRNPSYATNYAHINTQKVTDVRVRQALNYALDKQSIIDSVFEGVAARPVVAPLAPDVFGSHPNLETYDYDVEKAKELMEEAGYDEDNRLELYLMTNENDTRIAIATIMQEQYRQIYIDLTVDIMEWGAYLDAAAEGVHDLAILGWVAVTGDADYGLNAVYHGDSSPNAGNRAFYNNERVNELLDIGATSTDPEVREAAYHEAQEIIMEDAPHVYTHHTIDNAGMQSYVKGFELNPAGHHHLYGVYIER